MPTPSSTLRSRILLYLGRRRVLSAIFKIGRDIVVSVLSVLVSEFSAEGCTVFPLSRTLTTAFLELCFPLPDMVLSLSMSKCLVTTLAVTPSRSFPSGFVVASRYFLSSFGYHCHCLQQTLPFDSDFLIFICQSHGALCASEC